VQNRMKKIGLGPVETDHVEILFYSL
jgi:hypothetical protein